MKIHPLTESILDKDLSKLESLLNETKEDVNDIKSAFSNRNQARLVEARFYVLNTSYRRKLEGYHQFSSSFHIKKCFLVTTPVSLIFFRKINN